jgi:membrane-bound lytic murein transglycosylase D
MEIEKYPRQALSVVLFLALAGCATTPPEAPKQAQETTISKVTSKGKGVVEAAKVMVPAPAPSAVPILPADEPAVESVTPADTPVAGVKPEYPNIWSKIREGFSMEMLESPLVERERKWFVNNPEYMQRMMERAKLYLYYIVEEVEKRGMPMEIALLPAIESAYKPYAYSRARASGLWQFIPSTGRLYGLKANWWYDGRRDVEASTQAALDYLEKLHNDFDGDWHLAVAAYNAGEGKVMRMMKYNERKGKSTDFQYLKLKRETMHYVPKLMAMVSIVADPDKYGVQLADIPNEPYFARVETDSQVDLGVVAKLVDMPVDDLHKINPGYTRWATHPNGPHYLLVPADKKDALVEGLNNLPDDERVQWRHHIVKRGDTLHDVGRQYGVSVQALRIANNLRSNLLRRGQDLLIPIPANGDAKTIRTAYRKSGASDVPRGEPVIHRVRQGETLWSISRRYNVLVQQLTKWNLIHANDVLRLGQKLKIWTSGGPTALVEFSAPNS